MVKAGFLVICFLILLNCRVSETPQPPAPDPTPTPIVTNNCDSLHLRNDGGSGFYEANIGYPELETVTPNFETSGFDAAGLKRTVFEKGLDILNNHPTLLSFLLLRNDRIVFENYYNGSKASDSNNIHSASKSILSALTGIILDRGLLESTNQSLLSFFPDFTPSDTRKNDISLFQLLNMTSGFRWVEDQSEYEIEKSENWINSILSLPLDTAPGTAFNYSTANTHLLSAVLGSVVPGGLCAFMYERLMSPLEIDVEHWGRDPSGVYSGGYNFYLTPREMARFGGLYLNNGRFNGTQIVPESWVATAFKFQADAGGGFGYSHCWWITEADGIRLFLAWGFGGQFIVVIPDLSIVVVSTADTRGEAKTLDIVGFIRSYVIPAVK